MENCLTLNLVAPMMSFGTSRQAQHGPTDILPAKSMITGLLGNALGWDRLINASDLNGLQARITLAARLNHDLHAHHFLHDFQTVQVSPEDRAWTTSGRPAKRTSERSTLQQHHIRHQHYLSDANVTAVVRLSDPEAEPTVSQLAQALTFPERPIFIGRRCCVPSQYLLHSTSEHETAIAALMDTPLPEILAGPPNLARTRWETSEEHPDLTPQRTLQRTGVVEWRTHHEAGWTWWHEADLEPDLFPQHPPEPTE